MKIGLCYQFGIKNVPIADIINWCQSPTKPLQGISFFFSVQHYQIVVLNLVNFTFLFRHAINQQTVRKSFGIQMKFRRKKKRKKIKTTRIVTYAQSLKVARSITIRNALAPFHINEGCKMI